MRIFSAAKTHNRKKNGSNRCRLNVYRHPFIAEHKYCAQHFRSTFIALLLLANIKDIN